MSDLAIDQAGNGHHPLGMELTMMAVHLKDGFITTHPTNGMLDNDPATRELLIVGYIFRGPGFAFRFASRGCGQTLWMEFVDPNIGQITDGSDPCGQAVEQVRLLKEGDVSRGTHDSVSHINHLTGQFIDRHLAFEGMLLFLTTVVFIGLFAFFMALHPLFKGVNDHRQFGGVSQ